MPNVAQLGQQVKAKHPQYGDIPDEELGLKVQAKYPGAYDDFAPAPAAPRPVPAGLQGPPPSVATQILQNIPGSALKAITHPSFPGMPYSGPSETIPPEGTPELEAWRNNSGVSGLMNDLKGFIPHPIDDPVGTALMMAQMGRSIPKGTGAVLKGTAKGAWDGASAPSELNIKGLPIKIPGVPATLGSAGLGYEIGSHIPGIEGFGGPLGAGLGALIPGVRGAIKGGMQAYRDLPTPPSARVPIWTGPAAAPAGLPDLSPIAPGMTVNRIPKVAPTAPVRTPIWTGPSGQLEQMPDLSPVIPGMSVYRIPKEVPVPPGVGRVPGWQKAGTTSNPTVLPDLSSIPGTLPTGRIPGAPSFDLDSGEIVNPAGPGGASTGQFTALPPKTGLTPLPEGSPMPANAGTFKHTADYTDLLRQFHAQHPKGTSLRQLGSQVYGHAANALPSYDQALALHEWMLKNNWKPGMVLPSPGDLGK